MIKNASLAKIALSSFCIIVIACTKQQSLTPTIHSPTLSQPQIHLPGQVSPNSKWVAFTKGDELWISNFDNTTSEKLLDPIPEYGNLYKFVWSPDSTKIVVVHTLLHDIPEPVFISVVDLSTKLITEIIQVKTGFPILLAWSPSSTAIAFTLDTKIMVLDIAQGNPIATLNSDPGCNAMFGYLQWSPNGIWIVHSHLGHGRYSKQWICISDVRQSTDLLIDVNGTTSNPVWNQTGESLYFVAMNFNPDNPNTIPNTRLLRYDVTNQVLSEEMSLPNITNISGWTLSISQDGTKLALNNQGKEISISIP